jgi:hypothetical protein
LSWIEDDDFAVAFKPVTLAGFTAAYTETCAVYASIVIESNAASANAAALLTFVAVISILLFYIFLLLQ